MFLLSFEVESIVYAGNCVQTVNLLTGFHSASDVGNVDIRGG